MHCVIIQLKYQNTDYFIYAAHISLHYMCRVSQILIIKKGISDVHATLTNFESSWRQVLYLTRCEAIQVFSSILKYQNTDCISFTLHVYLSSLSNAYHVLQKLMNNSKINIPPTLTVHEPLASSSSYNVTLYCLTLHLHFMHTCL